MTLALSRAIYVSIIKQNKKILIVVIGTFLQCDLTAKMANPTFHLLSDEEISELISGIDSKNTKKTSKFAISKFESFAAYSLLVLP